MSRAVFVRQLYRAAISAPNGAGVSTAFRSSVRNLTSDVLRSGPGDEDREENSPENVATNIGTGDEVSQEDSAAEARRAALLKRYGDISTSEPTPVSAESNNDAEEKAKEEANHDEIWGDYVRYMENQRKKGWKT